MPKASGVYGDLHQPKTIDKPENPNIQLVNLKSEWKPFEIVSPSHAQFKIFNISKSYFSFGCWNHWPVTQIPSSGRYCVAADRASHSSLSHIFWDFYETNENSMTKILMDGLTTKSAAELAPLARSWISPPPLDLAGDGYQSEGYDPAQRAFVIVRRKSHQPVTLELTLHASDSSPIVDPAIVIKGWGDAPAQLEINGRPANWGKDFRRGHVQHLDGTDLVLWVSETSSAPVQIKLTPEP